ncbi:MAG: hypothetical protein JWP92_2094 [Caulobacter sp.]|nr:hypothetical protein [Caulobacter sp.]
MTPKVSPILCGLAFVGFASTAFASAIVQTVGRAEIVQSAGIAVTQNLSFKALLPTNLAAVSASTSTASIALLGGQSAAVSLATPSAFDVTRAGGPETLTVTTVSPTEHAVAGGALRANGGLSVNVGGVVALTGETMAPGVYHGLLVVIAQYN